MQRYKVLILIGLISQSCQSYKSNLKSKWQVLQQAEYSDCEKWKKRNQDLEITQITPLKLDKSGFIVQTRTRSGLRDAYFAPFDGDSVDLEKTLDLKWGAGARLIGVVNIEGSDHVVLQNSDKRGIKYLEVREPKSNIVKYSGSTKLNRLHGIEVHPSPNGFWLHYKIHDPNRSLDEEKSLIMEVRLQPDSKLKFVDQSKYRPQGEVKTVSLLDRKLMVFDLNAAKSKSSKNKINYTILDGENQKPLIFSIGSDELERVESWVVGRHRDGAIIIYVSGDTLIWENAKLEVVHLDSLGDTLWIKSFPIENEHIGDPILLGGTLESYLFLPKWLDAESTLHVHKISATGIESKGYHGIFREGTYASASYFHKEKSDLYVINQFPDGFIKSQAMCEIDL